MANSIDNIARQARQGSVAAIIQVLNDKLAHSGVRTRAVLENGVLQLLCEAAKAEQLEQSSLVERIRQILESLAPRNIRRVKINSRIVREQQLLWLEEINRDPENQLLWFQEITLAKPNFLKRLVEDREDRKRDVEEPAFPQQTVTSRFEREQRQFWRGIFVGGLGLTLLLLVLGWTLNNWFGLKLSNPMQAQTSKPAGSVKPGSSPGGDSFADAVRLAEQASSAGKVAASPADWLALAAKWQQAGDLMAAVPPAHPRYKIAQNRAALYRQNSEKAQQEAQKRRGQSY